MSFAKRELERQIEEGCHHLGGSVCPDCIRDYAVKDFVLQNLTHCSCTYCGRRSDEAIAANFNDVLSFISKGIWRAYARAENSLPYDSDEDGWQIVEPDDSSELFFKLCVNEAERPELGDDIVEAFRDCLFVPKIALSVPDHEILTYSWEEFCRQIKHVNRFVFFNIRRRRKPIGNVEIMGDPDDLSPPHKILECLGGMVCKFELVSELPSGSTLIRARQHMRKDRPKDGNALGSPPDEYASQSRMSPAGISMFYSAVDCQTCFGETYDPKLRNKHRFMTFARFKTLRKMRILDLTRIPDVPSIFDEEHFDLRDPLIFLNALVQDLSKSIERDGREHYEYVPTQVVSEYFRRIFRYKRRSLDGIAFQSSKPSGRTCVCLFVSNGECDPSSRQRQTLELDAFEIRRIDFDQETVVDGFPHLPTSSPLVPLQRELFVR